MRKERFERLRGRVRFSFRFVSDFRVLFFFCFFVRVNLVLNIDRWWVFFVLGLFVVF